MTDIEQHSDACEPTYEAQWLMIYWEINVVYYQLSHSISALL